MPDKVETIGQILVRDALPTGLKDFNKTLDKKAMLELFTRLAKENPDQYIDTLQKLNDIGRTVAAEHGRSTSVGLDDLHIPPAIAAFREQMREDIHKISQSDIAAEKKNEKIINYIRSRLVQVHSLLQDEAYGKGNAFAIGVRHGFRGSPGQLTQLLFGDLLVADHKGNAIPVAGLHGYGEGVTPMEYWAGSYGSRAGYSSVQFATADSGYFSKQMALMANRVKVTGRDCGAKNIGVIREGNDTDILGRVLAKDVGSIPAGTVIDTDVLKKLSDKKVLVRSVATCQQADGVCQKCAGHDERDKFPHLGAYIGVTAARSLAEPLTQGGLASKHIGGTVGITDKVLSGFEEINQFVQVPERFIGGAILAPKEGKIEAITKAPQGGSYIFVGSEKLYVPINRQITVKKGDMVDPGDVLTDGTPNPAEVTQYKGLGEGREYFVDKFKELLEKNGIKTHRRHVEALSKGFFDKVRITEPTGTSGYGVGDIVSYSDLQRHYKVRPDSAVIPLNRAKGQYLEQPVLHYTIGTLVTKPVIQKLRENGIPTIMTNKRTPPFIPEVIRLAVISSSDPDWKTQMASFGLKKTFLESAAKGSKSPHKTTSFVPGLMNAELMES